MGKKQRATGAEGLSAGCKQARGPGGPALLWSGRYLSHTMEDPHPLPLEAPPPGGPCSSVHPLSPAWSLANSRAQYSKRLLNPGSINSTKVSRTLPRQEFRPVLGELPGWGFLQPLPNSGPPLSPPAHTAVQLAQRIFARPSSTCALPLPAQAPGRSATPGPWPAFGRSAV